MIIRYTDHKPRKWTYDPPSILNLLGRTTTDSLWLFVDIKEGLSVNILDLVDPWLQFPVFEDGRVTG
jgi:hypothetical protein